LPKIIASIFLDVFQTEKMMKRELLELCAKFPLLTVEQLSEAISVKDVKAVPWCSK